MTVVDDWKKVDFDNLAQLITDIGNARNSNKIDYQNTFISNCTGDAIGQINGCIAKFDQICGNIDLLYDGSSNYVTKVLDNYRAAEAANTTT